MRMWIPRLHLVHWRGLRKQLLRRYAVLVVRGSLPPNEEGRVSSTLSKTLWRHAMNLCFHLDLSFESFRNEQREGFMNSS